jgi:hypothetical protein
MSDMRGLGLLTGIALVAVAASGSGLAIAGSPSNPKVSIASAASVTRAFALHGIPLRLEEQSKGFEGQPSAFSPVLSNQKVASTQGVISVMILRSAAEAKKLPVRAPVAFDCAGFPTSYQTLKARNIVATYTECFNLNPSAHLATSPVFPAFVAAMHNLAR